MSKNVFALPFLCFWVLASNISTAQCNAKQIVNECKPNIDPYQYDSYTKNQLVFDTTKSTTVEVEFTAFQGQEYKLVFRASQFNSDLTLNIYDKKLGSKSRRKVCDSENGIGKYWSFAPLKAGTYYIDYNLPKSTEVNKTACVVMLIGYK